MLNENSNINKNHHETNNEDLYRENIKSFTETNKIQLPADILKQLCDKYSYDIKNY